VLVPGTLSRSTAKRETGAGLTGSEHLGRAEAKGPDEYGHPIFHPAKDLPSPPASMSADLLISSRKPSVLFAFEQSIAKNGILQNSEIELLIRNLSQWPMVHTGHGKWDQVHGVAGGSSALILYLKY
jgi:hypothetical protein